MKEKIGEIRPSQFISTYGPGALIDLPNYSVILSGIDNWNYSDTNKIEEPRLRKRLKINSIRSLPYKDSDLPTIPSYRFPIFYVCPTCRKLAPYFMFNLNKEGAVFCNNNKDGASCENIKAFPVRYLSACTSGHLHEFPWFSFVHNKNRNCKDQNHLYLRDAAEEGKLEDVQIVECKSCNSKRPLSDAFDKSQKALPPCQGKRPWLGKGYSEECGKDQRIILRGASNLYFPVIEGVLSIPKQTISPLTEELEKLSDRLSNVKSYENLDSIINMGVFPELNNYSVEEIWEELLRNRGNSQLEDSNDLLTPEWNALTINRKFTDSEFHFEIEPQSLPTLYGEKFSNLVMVRRLREVRVLRTFTRINSAPDITSKAFTEANESDVGYSKIFGNEVDWLPGVETFGEGIFFAFKEEKIKDWESKPDIIKYEENYKGVFNQYYDDRSIPADFRPPFPGARYVMLHTLSHILIRNLCMHSGYSSSSLRERIYSQKEDGNSVPMSGILIYTSAPDSEGSLGGLVELGSSERFSDILWQSLEEARLCSADPLCSDYEPSHHHDLNGACCHSCGLIAETSCENSNRFLDRSLVINTVSKEGLNFF
jgi:hypothetical protein